MGNQEGVSITCMKIMNWSDVQACTHVSTPVSVPIHQSIYSIIIHYPFIFLCFFLSNILEKDEQKIPKCRRSSLLEALSPQHSVKEEVVES